MSRVRPLLLLLLPVLAGAVEVAWPTAMPRPDIRRPETFVQPAASGTVESGMFGMTRNDGTRFHEGLDIRPLAHDGRGEAVDLVRAAMPGRVAYLCVRATGPYGRYIVLEHPESGLPAYSLYAHLASVRGDLMVGAVVRAGQPLGVLGRSSGDEPIPRERAHLHFEIGLRLSDGFDSWRLRQPELRREDNPHGNFHGWNLAGLDPLPLLGKKTVDLQTVVNDLPAALVVKVRTRRTPDFVRRHPQLVTGSALGAAGWEVELTWHGLPKRWKPLPEGTPGLPASGWRIDAVKEQERVRLERRQMLAKGTNKPGVTLKRTMELAIGP